MSWAGLDTKPLDDVTNAMSDMAATAKSFQWGQYEMSILQHLEKKFKNVVTLVNDSHEQRYDGECYHVEFNHDWQYDAYEVYAPVNEEFSMTPLGKTFIAKYLTSSEWRLPQAVYLPTVGLE